MVTRQLRLPEFLEDKAHMALTSSDRNRLEKALNKRIHDDAVRCRQIGYPPGTLLGMMYGLGPTEACRQVIMAKQLPSGFDRLWKLNALELTAEYTILDGEWIELFDQKVRDQARRRLRDYGWNGPLPPF